MHIRVLSGLRCTRTVQSSTNALLTDRVGGRGNVLLWQHTASSPTKTKRTAWGHDTQRHRGGQGSGHTCGARPAHANPVWHPPPHARPPFAPLALTLAQALVSRSSRLFRSVLSRLRCTRTVQNAGTQMCAPLPDSAPGFSAHTSRWRTRAHTLPATRPWYRLADPISF